LEYGENIKAVKRSVDMIVNKIKKKTLTRQKILYILILTQKGVIPNHLTVLEQLLFILIQTILDT